MCRLLFLLNHGEQKKEFIYSFLLQSFSTSPLKNETKDTKEIIDNKMIKNHLDGFGFSWLENNKWNIYKNPIIYTEDKILPKKIDKMMNSKVIIGHIRNKTIGDKTIHNTHPFYHKNMVFSHNGWIKDFANHRNKIIEKIDPKYKKFIKGETDSEYLFYLLLTCKDIVEKNNKDIKETETFVLDKTITLFLYLLRELELDVLANIIFATQNTCVIMRYSIQTKIKSMKKKPLLLYYDDTDGLIISTLPMTKNSKLIKENSFILIDI